MSELIGGNLHQEAFKAAWDAYCGAPGYDNCEDFITGIKAYNAHLHANRDKIIEGMARALVGEAIESIVLTDEERRKWVKSSYDLYIGQATAAYNATPLNQNKGE